jgi:hypothetical protein
LFLKIEVRVYFISFISIASNFFIENPPESFKLLIFKESETVELNPSIVGYSLKFGESELLISLLGF